LIPVHALLPEKKAVQKIIKQTKSKDFWVCRKINIVNVQSVFFSFYSNFWVYIKEKTLSFYIQIVHQSFGIRIQLHSLLSWLANAKFPISQDLPFGPVVIVVVTVHGTQFVAILVIHGTITPARTCPWTTFHSWHVPKFPSSVVRIAWRRK
jgi:hypothetical protein